MNFQNSYEKSIQNNISNISHQHTPLLSDNNPHQDRKINLILDNSRGSQERVKFRSSEKIIKPVNLLSHSNSQNYIRPQVFESVGSRGYLSNFK